MSQPVQAVHNSAGIHTWSLMQNILNSNPLSLSISDIYRVYLFIQDYELMKTIKEIAILPWINLFTLLVTLGLTVVAGMELWFQGCETSAFPSLTQVPMCHQKALNLMFILLPGLRVVFIISPLELILLFACFRHKSTTMYERLSLQVKLWISRNSVIGLFWF